VAAIIGDPIAHTRSPAIYNAAFAATGLDWVFVALRVAPGHAARAVHGALALGLGGLTVTMPHKSDAAAVCDELTPTARALGAVNCVVLRDDRCCGDSTDGPGFLRSLGGLDIEPDGRSFVVLGAGGAGRAIVHALGETGARVVVAARRLDAARNAALLAPGAVPVAIGADLDELLSGADVVVNATPLGMHGEAPPFDTGLLGPRCAVFDTVYHPEETPLLAAARARGLHGTNGLGMLVEQAALIFEQLTGHAAPLDVMRAAAAMSPGDGAQ
jgi:shikimate dehydrogenase